MLSWRAAGGRAGGAFLVNVFVNLFCRFDFLAKYSTCVLQISHIVFSGSLLSCGAMFFSVGFQVFGEKCIFWRYVFFLYLFFHKPILCIFHNSKTIQGIWIMDLYRDVDPDDQARCTQVA